MNTLKQITIGEALAASNNMRVGSSKPEEYRLARTVDGGIILQGLFAWREGNGMTGADWVDIDTVDHPSVLAAEKLNAQVSDTCPECRRKKAHSADDCAAGLCPKWYAIRDKEAVKDCEDYSQQNKQPVAITDTDRLEYVFKPNRLPSKELVDIELSLINEVPVPMERIRAAIDASITEERTNHG